MDWVDWIAIVASVFSIVSFTTNIVQLMHRRQANRALRDLGQRMYVSMYKVAEVADEARKLIINPPPDQVAETRLMEAQHLVERIRGIAFAERNACVSFMREHLGRVPRWEHPAEPKAVYLEKCRRFERKPDAGEPAEINTP